MTEVLVRNTEQTNAIQTYLLLAAVLVLLPFSQSVAFEDRESIAFSSLGDTLFAMVENAGTLAVEHRELSAQLIAYMENVAFLTDGRVRRTHDLLTRSVYAEVSEGSALPILQALHTNRRLVVTVRKIPRAKIAAGIRRRDIHLLDIRGSRLAKARFTRHADEGQRDQKTDETRRHRASLRSPGT